MMIQKVVKRPGASYLKTQFHILKRMNIFCVQGAYLSLHVGNCHLPALYTWSSVPGTT